MTIAERLRWLLELEGRSITDLSKASGIKYETLQQYLAGKRKPGAEQLGKLASCGISLEWLLLGKDEPSLKIIFSEFKDLRGPLAADREMASVFFYEAINAADKFHRTWVEQGGEIVGAYELLARAWDVFSFYDSLLTEHSEKIVDLRKKGADTKDLYEIIVTEPVREKVRSMLEKAIPEMRREAARLNAN